MALYKDSEYFSGDGSILGMPAQLRVRFSKATGAALTHPYSPPHDIVLILLISHRFLVLSLIST